MANKWCMTPLEFEAEMKEFWKSPDTRGNWSEATWWGILEQWARERYADAMERRYAGQTNPEPSTKGAPST